MFTCYLNSCKNRLRSITVHIKESLLSFVSSYSQCLTDDVNHQTVSAHRFVTAIQIFRSCMCLTFEMVVA
jgi:hypothetical protein